MISELPLRFEGVRKEYATPGLFGSHRTFGVDGLDMEIQRGEFFGLLGLNGSGKTTTMKLALGLLRPTTGRVCLFGQDPCEGTTLQHVGFLPELPYFYSHLNPTEALRFYGRLSRMDQTELMERIPLLLERVGLWKRRSLRVAEFSKGLLQRLGLAQAMLHDPSLLILDEPVSGLDPLAIKETRDLLRGLRKQGKTVFLSSHSISEVEILCNRVGILSAGRLVRTVESSEWARRRGALEDILVETVQVKSSTQNFK